MARRQEYGGFDGVHLSSVREREQQSRRFGHLFKLSWMVDTHVAFVVTIVADRRSRYAQERCGISQDVLNIWPKQGLFALTHRLCSASIGHGCSFTFETDLYMPAQSAS